MKIRVILVDQDFRDKIILLMIKNCVFIVPDLKANNSRFTKSMDN